MGVRGTGLALCLLFGGAIGAAGSTEAASPNSRKPALARMVSTGKVATVPGSKRRVSVKPVRRVALEQASGGISCVPYARQVTGMAVSGNGGQWWYNAAGQYERGNRPLPGSVLAFRGSAGMSLGHVAVVSQVVGQRHLRIDHANWGGPGIRRGSVMHNVNVVDVSENNDWTQVRVQVGWDTDTFGRVYPTFGFIHNRPANPMLHAGTVGRNLIEVAEMPRIGR